MSAPIERFELRRLALSLVTPFRTAFGEELDRDVLLVRVTIDGVDGWGECVAFREPGYTSEYVEGAHAVMREHLLPRLLAAGPTRASGLATVWAGIPGHPMAKAAIELAVLDAELRIAGISLASHLGATRDRVDCGVSIGRFALPQLLEQVAAYVGDGYRRVKLKIEPGHDVEPVRAIREAFPDVSLQVDANGSYIADDRDALEALTALDEFDLLLIEQPLPADDLLGHARLAQHVRTPICLDESITSARVAEQAIELGACAVVNIKAGRVGGYLEAVRVHDVCAARDVPVWCGGMLETGIGRAANLALAGLPAFTLPGDISASERYYARDVITTPFALEDGTIAIPTTPGLGVDVDLDFVDQRSSVTTPWPDRR